MIPQRKSITPSELETKTDIKHTNTLTIVAERKDPEVEDFLNDYKFKYEEIDSDEAGNALSEALRAFFKENSALVIEGYTSADLEAVQEGFARSAAITELFFQSLYLNNQNENESGN